jgi:hypothetical protein
MDPIDQMWPFHNREDVKEVRDNVETALDLYQRQAQFDVGWFGPLEGGKLQGYKLDSGVNREVDIPEDDFDNIEWGPHTALPRLSGARETMVWFGMNTPTEQPAN